MFRYIALMFALLFSVIPLLAQDETPPSSPTSLANFGIVFPDQNAVNVPDGGNGGTHAAPPELIPAGNPVAVFIEASDKHKLAADFYLVNPANPTVILIHQLYSNRSGWFPLTALLTQSGFNVLAVDLRGHGATRGGIDWLQSLEDMRLWFKWLREMGVRGDAISTIGSSIGSTMAIVSCANDPACRTAIAFSPGRSYFGISIEEALQERLANRSTLILYAARDRYPAVDMPAIMASARGELVVHEYPGNAHGFDFMRNELDTVAPIVIDWLRTRGG